MFFKWRTYCIMNDVFFCVPTLQIKSCAEACSVPLANLTSRAAHLDSLGAHAADASSRQIADADAFGTIGSFNIELERLVLDFLLRVGSIATLQSAKSIYTRTGRQSLLDTPVFAITLKVCPSLLRRDATLALAWCAENQERLESTGSSLALHLRIAQFVEFLKLDQVHSSCYKFQA